MPQARELLDHWRKLRWAQQHFGGFNESVKRFTESKPYEMAGRHDVRSGKYVGRLARVTPVPDDWSLRIADAVHCLRSALDVLVYQLAVRNRGKKGITASELRKLGFVMATDADDFRRLAEEQLQPLSDEMREAIHGIQTYSLTDPRLHNGLLVLRNLSNLDKHRLIVPTLVAARGAKVEARLPGQSKPRVLGTYDGPIKEGVRVLNVDTKVVASLQRQGATFHASLGLVVQFENKRPAFGGSVDEFLRKTIHYCEHAAFPALERFL